MSNTISEDEFIRTLVPLLDRKIYVVSEDHVKFQSNDLNVMIHAWYEDGFYSGGSSERLSPPWQLSAGELSYSSEAVASHAQL